MEIELLSKDSIEAYYKSKYGKKLEEPKKVPFQIYAGLGGWNCWTEGERGSSEVTMFENENIEVTEDCDGRTTIYFKDEYRELFEKV